MNSRRMHFMNTKYSPGSYPATVRRMVTDSRYLADILGGRAAYYAIDGMPPDAAVVAMSIDTWHTSGVAATITLWIYSTEFSEVDDIQDAPYMSLTAYSTKEAYISDIEDRLFGDHSE